MHLVTGMCQPWCPAMAPWAAPAGSAGLVPVAAQGCALPWAKENVLFKVSVKKILKIEMMRLC